MASAKDSAIISMGTLTREKQTLATAKLALEASLTALTQEKLALEGNWQSVTQEKGVLEATLASQSAATGNQQITAKPDTKQLIAYLASGAIAGALATLIAKKILDPAKREIFRSMKPRSLAQLASNPELLKQLKQLRRSISDKLMSGHSNLSEETSRVKELFEACNMKNITEELQAVVNLADADFTREWKNAYKANAEYLKVWDEIRGLLTESTLATNDYPTEIRDTLNEISLYQDLINQNCNLSTAAVAA